MKQFTDGDWKEKLTSQQYAILRGKSTEVPFSGKLLSNKKSGTYVCAACGAKLFKSEHKFDSGSGWPSFYDIASNDSVTLHKDSSHGMQRTEASCSSCDSHLGHLFNDASDQPTNKRYCINSASLEFKDQKDV